MVMINIFGEYCLLGDFISFAGLAEVAKEKCFALHGGTAINLFVRDMPGLCVDIDLLSSY
jgi:hypothetical protein